jgi:hypothetical protein
MPKVSEMIESKFLRKEDVDEDIVVSIKGVSLENMPGEEGKQRWVLAFRELPKGLVLNATTIRVLEKAFGQHSDDWAGKRVTLFVDPNVSFKGQVVGGLRLRPMKRTPPAAKAAESVVRPPPPQPAGTGEEFDDDVPL